MKNPLTAIAAAAIPLLLSPLAAADEPSFNVPTTTRAQESATLLSRAAHAIYKSPLDARDRRISNLWLFPTGDAKTVFARYTLSSDDGSAPTSEQLVVLTLQGDRIVEQRDLTAARVPQNWSAAGYASIWSARARPKRRSSTSRNRSRW